MISTSLTTIRDLLTKRICGNEFNLIDFLIILFKENLAQSGFVFLGYLKMHLFVYKKVSDYDQLLPDILSTFLHPEFLNQQTHVFFRQVGQVFDLMKIVFVYVRFWLDFFQREILFLLSFFFELFVIEEWNHMKKCFN